MKTLHELTNEYLDKNSWSSSLADAYRAGFLAAREMALIEISRNACFDEKDTQEQHDITQARYQFISDNIEKLGEEEVK